MDVHVHMDIGACPHQLPILSITLICSLLFNFEPFLSNYSRSMIVTLTISWMRPGYARDSVHQNLYSTGNKLSTYIPPCAFTAALPKDPRPLCVQPSNKWSKNFEKGPHRRGQFFTKGAMQCDTDQSAALQSAAAVALWCRSWFFAAYNAAVTYNAFQWAGQTKKLSLRLGDLDAM